MRLILVLILAALGAPRAATEPGPTAFHFPATPVGRLASAWFVAYEQGEAAMRSFITAHVSPAGLERRGLEERITIYRDMRGEQGRLTPIEVGESRDDQLTVIARTEGGARLSLSILCEPGEAHSLAGIRVENLPDQDRNVRVGAPSNLGAEDTGPTGPPMTDAEVAAALRARLDSLAHMGAFSGAVLLTHGARVLLREAYGLASRREQTPNRPDTRFNLGSINKIFTRVAIQQLAVAGKLRLSDTIDRYLSDYPSDKGRRITIAQLIDHRAGTGDIFNQRFNATDVSRLRSIGDWMDLIRDQPLDFEPGTRQEYSNAGYVLLGAIVEKVSGLSYYAYVRAHIFEPAGMRATDSYARDEIVPNRAIGYTRRLGAAVDASGSENIDGLPGRGSSAGGGYSTADDLEHFADALRAGRLGIPAEPEGLGIAGGSPGVNAVLEMMGEYTAVVLANLDPPTAERVAAELRGWLRRAGASGRRALESGRAAAGGPIRRVIHAGTADDPNHLPERTLLPPLAVEVPMLQSGHLPAVDVMVNGKGPFRFAIDTGGAGTARVDSALAARLGLKQIGEVMAGDPSGKNLRSLPLVALDSIEIGGARFVGLTASVRSYNEPRSGEPIDGMLGFGLFAECLFTLDYPANRVRIARGELPPADGDRVLDFSDPRGIPSVTLRVGGLEIEADVDAGAMGGFSLPESLASRLSLASEPRVVGHARTVTNSFDIKAADLKGEIALGGIRFENPTVEFQPLFPMANVGSRVLRDFRITFDQKNKRIQFERAQAPSGSQSR